MCGLFSLPHTNWLQQKLGDWGAYAVRNRRRVLWAAAAITLLALPFALRALNHLESDLFDPPSNSFRRLQILRELEREFDGDILTAVVCIPDNHSVRQVQELKSFGLLLCDELSKIGKSEEDRQYLDAQLRAELPPDQPWLRHVQCRAGQGIEHPLRKFVKEHPFVLLNPGDIASLKKMFEPKALSEKMEEIAVKNEDLPPNSAEKLKLQQDPLGILDLAQTALHSRLAGRQHAMAGDEGFLLSPDQTTLVIMGRTVLLASRLDFDAALMPAAQRAKNRAIESFRRKFSALTTALKGPVFCELAPGETLGTLQVGFTGSAAVSIENERTLTSDIIMNMIAPLVGVLVLLAVSFRSLRLIWAVVWTTVLIVLWTLAVAGLSKGGISLMGGAFTAVPVVLGTNYTILLYTVYRRVRQGEATGAKSISAEEAMRQILMHAGPRIVVAAAITALAFFGVGFSHLPGLAEFGILSGTSAMLSCAMILGVYPAAFPGSTFPSFSVLLTFKQLGFGIPAWGRLFELPGVKPLCLVSGAGGLLACMLLIKFGPDPGNEIVAGVRYDSELSHLNSRSIRAISVHDRIRQRFGLGLPGLRMVVEAATSDEQQAFFGNEQVIKRLQPFVDRHELTANGNVNDFVPSPEQQRATLSALKSFDFDAATAAFRKAATARFGNKGIVFFKPFLRELGQIQAKAQEAEVLTLESLMQGPLSQMLANFVKIDSGSRRVSLVSSWLPVDSRQAEWYARVAETVETNLPPGVTVSVTAPRMAGFELKASAVNDCIWITAVCAFCIALLLGIALRSLKNSILTAVPLLFAYAVMLAGVPFSQMMGWNYSLNIVNLAMFPLLLGTVLPCGVYMVFDSIASPRPNISVLMAHTGRSVFYCTATTLIAFGTFVSSSYNGLISMGMASLFAYAGAGFGALVVLPALLRSVKNE